MSGNMSEATACSNKIEILKMSNWKRKSLDRQVWRCKLWAVTPLQMNCLFDLLYKTNRWA
jgi:hypothetical protein